MLLLTDKEQELFKQILKTNEQLTGNKLIKLTEKGVCGMYGTEINNLNSNTILKYVKACIENYKKGTYVVVGYDDKVMSKYYAEKIFEYLLHNIECKVIFANSKTLFKYIHPQIRKELLFGIVVENTMFTDKNSEYGELKIYSNDLTQPEDKLAENLYKSALYAGVSEDDITLLNYKDKESINTFTKL